VDLAVESLEHPGRYPLVSLVRPNKRLQQSGTKSRRPKSPRPRGPSAARSGRSNRGGTRR
jgi:hypothetical protein